MRDNIDYGSLLGHDKFSFSFCIVFLVFLYNLHAVVFPETAAGIFLTSCYLLPVDSVVLNNFLLPVSL